MSSDSRVAWVLAFVLAAPWPCLADQPQWGQDNGRNMVCPGRDLPGEGWSIDSKADGESLPDDCLWRVRLGSHNYGNPVLADGRIYVGSNDAGLRDGRTGSRGGGVLRCLDARTGDEIWRLPMPKLRMKGIRSFDSLHLGVCSPATVEGDRLWVVSNRGEVLCLDQAGMSDGNDGSFQDEGKYIGGWFNTDGLRKEAEVRRTDGDILWRYDMISQAGVMPHDAANSSVMIVGDLAFVGTSNGVNHSHDMVGNTLAPSLIVLDKNTGKLVAQDDEKIGKYLFHGQWSSPAAGKTQGRSLVFYAAGDGYCYAFAQPETDEEGKVQKLEKVWWADCNPPDYRLKKGRRMEYGRGGPSEIIATPVFHDGRVYVAIGQDPAHGTGPGNLVCLDASGEGNISREGLVWSSTLVDRTLSTVSIADGLLYIADYTGRLHCFDADSGERIWVHDTESRIWASTMVADGKVYLGTEAGELWVFRAGRDKEVLGKLKLDHKIYCTVIAVDGRLYVATERSLYAFGKEARVDEPRGR